MKNYRPRILQSDWSIASRHDRYIYIYRLYFFLFFVVLYFIIAC